MVEPEVSEVLLNGTHSGGGEMAEGRPLVCGVVGVEGSEGIKNLIFDFDGKRGRERGRRHLVRWGTKRNDER